MIHTQTTISKNTHLYIGGFTQPLEIFAGQKSLMDILLIRKQEI